MAAYFAVQGEDDKDGELWAFDYDLYHKKGGEQWKRWPETTIDGSGDGSKVLGELTAFTVKEPPDWFSCGFYPAGFHRQNAQLGAYSLTARFGQHHDAAIANLLGDNYGYHLYIVPAKLKPTLRTLLRENHGIWRGSLFPDSAGAAETAREVFKVNDL